MSNRLLTVALFVIASPSCLSAQLVGDISLVSPRTGRLRCVARAVPLGDGDSLMLAGQVPSDDSWQVEESSEEVTYTSAAGRLRLIKNSAQIDLYDADGRLLTRTQTLEDRHTLYSPTPFSIVRRHSRGSTNGVKRSLPSSATRWGSKTIGCTSRSPSS